MAPAKKSSKKATKKGATKEKAKSTTKKALLKVCKLLFRSSRFCCCRTLTHPLLLYTPYLLLNQTKKTTPPKQAKVKALIDRQKTGRPKVRYEK